MDGNKGCVLKAVAFFPFHLAYELHQHSGLHLYKDLIKETYKIP
jgi:hypothetical protein